MWSGRAFLHRKNAGFSPFIKQNGSVNIGCSYPMLALPFFFCSGCVAVD
ncbi:hypothetical protein BACCAP_02492 [Pseudoflavonifractor capillosus ATCC 29799]|uniref:Uncharacterized protein n=1 Tax=Pseudoflavonifractor capillosus ATCC 29799 TaxID=411467 RepID=A6NW99_9FIRM|nr:hypothetical protein BACCAP_02492 [Pseudoflavonifractor capillosus ATCC 29799]